MHASSIEAAENEGGSEEGELEMMEEEGEYEWEEGESEIECPSGEVPAPSSSEGSEPPKLVPITKDTAAQKPKDIEESKD